MFRDSSVSYEADGWHAVAQTTTRTGSEPWRRVDAELRSLAKRYVALDAELARWLREAERVKLWRHCGCTSMLDYLERVFGFSPRQARERLLVARRLADLPRIADALGTGELPYTAVRELSRVATSTTEDAWLDRARGKTLRQVEDLVAQHEPGDLPDDAPRPDVAPMRVVLDVMPATYALFRQVWKLLEQECGHALGDDALLSALLNAAVAPPDDDARKGRAKFQIAVTTCKSCKRAVQHGGGKTVEIYDADRERAMCDAQHIGSLDTDKPQRATQDVPPRIRRLVMHRDGYRCRFPGCRSARFLEVHHLVHREHGGTHDPSGLTVLCDAHHKQHHDGLITITGRAPDQLTFYRGSPGVVVFGPTTHSELVDYPQPARTKQPASRTRRADDLPGHDSEPKDGRGNLRERNSHGMHDAPMTTWVTGRTRRAKTRAGHAPNATRR